MNPQIITAILSKDRTSTSYKYALLRSVVQCISDHHSHIRKGSKGWIQFPYGILIFYWLLYYFPILGHKHFIPQMNGEAVHPDEGNQLAIRPLMKPITDYYAALNENAFSEFRSDLYLGTTPPEIQTDLLALARKIQQTIKKMPMKHLGVSQFEEHYSLINATPSTVKKVSMYHLIQQSGTFYIRQDLYEVLLELGPIILGEESILDSWSSYTQKTAEKIIDSPQISKEYMYSLLSEKNEPERETREITTLVEAYPELNVCVWSGTTIHAGQLNIDHVIPYSHWKNNSLWNLLPATQNVNSKKRDKIPSPQLIEASRSRIISAWLIYGDHLQERFYNDLYKGFGIETEGQLNEAVDGLIFKSKYLIQKRGLPVFDL